MIINHVKKSFVKERLRFLFYEITITFLLIFFASTIEWMLIPIGLNPNALGMAFYLIRGIIVLIAIPITIKIMRRLTGPSQKEMRQLTKISVFNSHFMLYKITKSNYKYQLLDGFLLLFLVFIPLNFFLYLLNPEMILYHSISLGLVVQNSYLFIDNFMIFFALLIVIQISVAFTEETIYRGFFNKRGSEQFNQISAVFISAYSYAFLSLLFYLNPVTDDAFNWFPLIWFIASFIIGIILSLVTLRKKWLFPAIFAHSISNIFIICMIWCFLNGWGYLELMLLIYIPFLILSLILLIFNYERIKGSISIGVEMLKKYIKNDGDYEKKSDKYFQVVLDILSGFYVFLIGLLITL